MKPNVLFTKSVKNRFVLLNLVFFILQILTVLFFWRHLPSQIPLFYSRPWGEEQLSTPGGLLILPGLTLVVFVINFIFSLFVSKEEKLLRSILFLTTTVFGLFSLITLVQVIRLVS